MLKRKLANTKHLCFEIMPSFIQIFSSVPLVPTHLLPSRGCSQRDYLQCTGIGKQKTEMR